VTSALALQRRNLAVSIPAGDNMPHSHCRNRFRSSQARPVFEGPSSNETQMLDDLGSPLVERLDETCSAGMESGIFGFQTLLVARCWQSLSGPSQTRSMLCARAIRCMVYFFLRPRRLHLDHLPGGSLRDGAVFYRGVCSALPKGKPSSPDLLLSRAMRKVWAHHA